MWRQCHIGLGSGYVIDNCGWNWDAVLKTEIGRAWLKKRKREGENFEK